MIFFFIPVWILTRCSLEVNWSLTVNTWPFSISLDFGSLVRTLCVGFPQARDCSARTSSLSGMSVSCWISYIVKRSGLVSTQHRCHRLKIPFPVCPLHIKSYGDQNILLCWVLRIKLCTSKVDFSLLLKSMRMVIWKVDTWSMCFLVLEPVTWAPPTPTSDPSSCSIVGIRQHKNISQNPF